MTTKPVFVTREYELRRLTHFLKLAFAGGNPVCFVIGDAGSGKTSLVREFALRALNDHEDLIIASSQCDSQTGIGDAYLPFREVMAQLTGDVDTRLTLGGITEENASRLRKFLGFSGQALVDLGPDLIGIFVPGVGLATRAATFLAEKAGWLDRLETLTKRNKYSQGTEPTGADQNQIFEQYSNVLIKLTTRQPLLVVLDDLQWADAASIELLFRLARRIQGSRILVIGTYRPVEIAAGRLGERHPLEKVCTEFKRYFGDICVDLNKAQETEGQKFVDSFIATEPNRLSKDFHLALYHHTNGHPLFTVELLRAMQESGDLIQDPDGRWIEGPDLDWDELPARVEGVIEERIGRLEAELQETLTLASVEGESFTAEVVAHLQTMDARRLILRLGRELDSKHRLVSAQSTRRLDPDGQRISLYRFQHHLFQAYLYKNLDQVERTYLHEEVGRLLEALYGDQVNEVVVQLAHHFTTAGVTGKARRYLRWAGEQAASRYANSEALNFFNQALDLTPEDVETRQERYALLMARENIYNLLGERDAQEMDLASLKSVVDSFANDEPEAATMKAELALRRARWDEITANYPGAIQAIQTAINLAQATHNLPLEARGYAGLGFVYWRKGEYQAAQISLEKGRELAKQAGLREIEARCIKDLGIVFWRRGDHPQARAYNQDALKIYQSIGSRRGESNVWNNMGNICWSQDEFTQAEAYYRRSLVIAQEIGDKRSELSSLGNLGIIAARLSENEVAIEFFDRVLQTAKDIEDRESEGRALGNLGSIYMSLGVYPESKSGFVAALKIFQETDNRQAECWIHSGLGFLYLEMGRGEEAASHSRACLDMAEELGLRSYQASGLNLLGLNLERSGDFESAFTFFKKAETIRHELDQNSLAMECTAGMARIMLAQDNFPQALSHVEDILQYIAAKDPKDTEEPLQTYLVCYRVLAASRDPREVVILRMAHQLLKEQASKIKDEDLRRSFLENVRVHRDIIAAQGMIN